MFIAEAQTTTIHAKVAALESLLDLEHKSPIELSEVLMSLQGNSMAGVSMHRRWARSCVSISTKAPTDSIHAICAAREFLLDVLSWPVRGF